MLHSPRKIKCGGTEALVPHDPFYFFLHKNDCAFDSVNYFLRVILSCRTSLLTFFFALIFANQLRAADSPIDYLNPNVFTGTIYSDASLKQVLFTFRRTATNSGSEIHVLREFILPNGKLAVRGTVLKIRRESFHLPDTVQGEPVTLPPPAAGRLAQGKIVQNPFMACLNMSVVKGGFNKPGPAAIWFRVERPIASSKP